MGLVRYYDIAIGYVIVPIFRYRSPGINQKSPLPGSFFFFFFFFFVAGGVAMVLQHRYFIQKTLITGTICSHGYGFDIYALITAFRK